MTPNSAKPFVEARDLLLRLRTDYDAATREFRWPVMDRFNWALDYFDHLPPDDLALWCIGEIEEKLTFGALQARSNQVANHLRELGVRRGDRVMLLLPNVRQLWEAMLALIKLGAVFSPSPALLTETEIRDRFERGRMHHAIVDASLVGRLANLTGGLTRIAVGDAPGWHRFEDAYDAHETFAPDGETRASDPLVLYFTSGTTAKPKLVLHAHESYPVGLLSAMYAYGLQPGDLTMGIAPPGWAAHVYGLFAVWSTPAAIVALAQPRFDANNVLEVLGRCGVTLFGGPPTVWRLLIQQDMGSRPAQLREVLSGGEPLNPEVIEHVERVWGLTLRDVYGQTETTMTVGNSPGQAIVPGSMGRPMPGYDMKLLDENGAEAQEGEIAIALEPRPLGLLQGYQQADGSIVPIEGRYYRTGDLARTDSEGRLTFIGRADDVFKSSDYRLSPFEIESALIEHEAVAEVAVVPSPDPQRLVVPKAFITPAAGHPPDRATAFDIFSRLRGRLAPYKRVRRIEFCELPKTISGKIRRAELRQQEEARRRDGVRGPAEFWEEDFPELAARSPVSSSQPRKECHMIYALHGRVGLVTGAGGGIGCAIARRLAREGMAIAVLDRDVAAAEAIGAEIGGLAVTADVTSEDEVGRAVEAVVARLGQIDLLVNNAGVAWMGPVLEMPIEALRAMLQVNVEGVFIVSRAVLQHMIARRSGSIVNLSSWAGKTGNAYFAGYSASKFAMIGLTQALAREMAPHGIRVNAICPGIVVDTAMRTAIEAQQRHYRLPETSEREKSIPIGRVSVPEDVARVAAFLASDESSYMTGESINLSGGLLMD